MEQIQFIYFQDYMQYYFPSQRKQHVYGNLASRMMVPICFGFTIVKGYTCHIKRTPWVMKGYDTRWFFTR